MSSPVPDAKRAGFLYLAVTGVGWGLNWPVMKILLQDWPPLFARGVAGIVACMILAVIAVTRGERLSFPPREFGRLSFAAFTNVFAWMGFGTMSMVSLTVGEAALIVYTMPIWAMLFAWPLSGTKPTVRSVGALLLGVAGIAVLFAGQGSAFGLDRLLGILAAFGAAIFFALGTVLRRRPLSLQPVALVVWQMALGCVPMLVIGALFEHPRLDALSRTGWIAFTYMTLGPMAVCYLSWFATLRHLPATTASIGILIVPPIGVISAAAMLGEPLGVQQLLALALTLGGVSLALRAPRQPVQPGTSAVESSLIGRNAPYGAVKTDGDDDDEEPVRGRGSARPDRHGSRRAGSV